MNKNRHRLIFNAARGQRMAVQETASSAGKAASGHTRAGSAGRSAGPTGHPSFGDPPTGQFIASSAASLLLGLALTASPLLSGDARAQIVADPAAPGGQRAIVLTTPNGLPLVNIQTPSAAGVSRNTFSQFDVQAGGAVLNNSRTNVQSQLGGWVQGNPFLANGGARVILNEVNSTNPSLLRGAVEVAGQRAEVIVANPAGISIDGATFLNASRVTLTTGTPLLNGGNLEGYRVQGGSIRVDGAGLDARRADYTALLARAVQVNAGIWASSLRVAAGANTVDSGQGDITGPAQPSGAAPGFALDVSQLGGMYAGKIVLVGSEAGLGVRNAGTLASTGELVLQANGWLTDTGTLQAQADARIAAAGITNSGRVLAGQTLVVATDGALDNSGGTLNAHRLDIHAARLANRNGAIEQTGGQALALQAAVLSNAAGGQVGQLASVLPSASGADTGTGANTSTRIGAGGGSPSTVTDTDTSGTGNAGTPTAATTPPAPPLPDGLVAITGLLDNDAGHISAAGGIDLASGHGLRNAGGALQLRQLTVAGGDIDNRGGTLATSGAMQLAPGQAGSLLNAGGRVNIGGPSVIEVATLDNQGGEILQASADAWQLQVAGALDNRHGRIAGNGETTVQAARLDNRAGSVQALGAAGLAVTTAGALDNTGGQLVAGGGLQVDALALHNGTGLIAGNGPVRLGAGALDNTGGTIASIKDTLTLATTAGPEGIVNAGGRLQALGAVRLTGGALDNQRGLVSGSALHIDTAGHVLDNRLGTLLATDAAAPSKLATGRLDNDAGLIQAAGDLHIGTAAQELTNRHAERYAGTADHPQAGGGGIGSQGALTLATGALDNSAGFIGAQGAIEAETTTVANAGGVVAGQSAVTFAATGFDNHGGQVQAVGAVALDAGTGTLDNSAGLLRSAGAVTLGAGAIVNTHTAGAAQGIEGASAVLQAATIANDHGAIRTDGNATLTATQRLGNTAGLLSAGHTLALSAPAIDNTGGTAIAGQLTRIGTTSLIMGAGGRILSQGDLALDLRGDFDNAGDIIANGQARLTIAGQLANSGKLQAGDTLDLTAAAIDNAATGEMSATTTRIATPGTFTNRGLVDGQETLVDADTLRNLGSGHLYGDHLAIRAGRIDNHAETLAGTTKAGVIAARERLDIAVDALDNRDGALILSGGAGEQALNIGGTLDAAHHAEGQAQSVENTAATIESLGGLAIHAARIANRSGQGQLTLGPGASRHVDDYVADNGAVYTDNDFGWKSGGMAYKFLYRHVPGAMYFGGIYVPDDVQNGGQLKSSPYADPRYQPFYEGPEAYVPEILQQGSEHSLDDMHRPAEFHYSRSSTIWQVFGVEPPATENPPVAPAQSILGEPPTAQDLADYAAAIAPWIKLQAKLDDFRSVAASYMVTAKTLRHYTETGQALTGTTGKPGQILSAGDMILHASESLLNASSRIVAGGVLRATGAALQNPATEIVTQAHREGTLTTWAVVGQDCDPLLSCSNIYGWRDYAYQQDVPHTLTLPIGEVLWPTDPRKAGSGSGKIIEVAPALAALPATEGSGLVQANLPGAGTPTGPTLGGAFVVRTLPAAFTLPTASLFNLTASPTARYLVETDPRFADYRQWLGSDYLLAALGIDPATIDKRLGDGFYEQRLLHEQVLQLTGRRFLGDYASDQAEFLALMNNARTYARAWQLVPGVALTAAQMAQLTSDVVWLVAQDVTLPDGSVQRVLVPQLYVRVKQGDIDDAGSLIAGDSVDLKFTGDLTNGGTIAGRHVTRIDAHDIVNLRGLIKGDDVALHATRDLDVIGGIVAASHGLSATADHDIKVASTTLGTQGQSPGGTHGYVGIDRVAGLYVTDPGGKLSLSAGHDLALDAADLGSGGSIALEAKGDITFGTVQTGEFNDVAQDARNFISIDRHAANGSHLAAQGDITMDSGGSIHGTAATLDSAGGAILGKATGDITFDAGRGGSGLSTGSHAEGSGFLISGSATRRDSFSTNVALGSSLGGKTIALEGHDITISGSQVISDAGTTLIARNNLAIVADEGRQAGSSYSSQSESGLMDSGGLGVTLGERERSTDHQERSTTATGSTVGSLGGNVVLVAGNAYTQVGSDVLAPDGDIVIKARSVSITEARDTTSSQTDTKFRQSGLTLDISAPAMSAGQQAAGAIESAGDSKTGRAQLMALANVGAAFTNGAGSAGQGSGVNASLSYGSSQSQSSTTTITDTGQGSTVKAGGNVAIIATGGGQESNLLIRGANVEGGGDVTLYADNKVSLLAVENTVSQRSTNSSSSSSFGVTYGSDGVLANASTSGAKGHANSDDLTHTNTHVNAGKTLAIGSGGDTELIGAVASGNKVVMDVKGNLIIQSLQDTSTYDSSQQSAGGSLSLGTGKAGGNVNASGSHVESQYASVNEQSGVHAGDGGFNVTVGGKTTLIGGVITSTDQAVRDGLNYFDPKGGIELHDIQNTASYSGSAAGFAVGGGSNPNGAGLNGTGIGIGTDKGSASSVTSSGVSGMYGNTAVRTGDGPTGIHRIFDADKVQKEIDAQNLLMQTFTREVPKAAGGFADGKARELQTSDPAEAAKWADGGVYRVALHTVIGGLGGGVGGAIGAGAAAAGARVMNDIQNDVANALVNAGMNPAAAQAVAQGVTTTAAIGIGGALGGGSGAALAGGIDANNRQLHPNEQQRLDTAKRGKSPEEQRRLDDAACALVHCASGLDPTSPGYAAAVQSQYRGEFYAAEQQQLRGTGAFTYTWTDQATDGVRSIGNTIVNVAGPQVQSASRGAANLLDQALSAMRSTDPTLPPDLPGNDNGPKTGGGGTAVVTPPLVACMPPMCVVMPPVVVGTAPRGNVTLSENSESQPTINTSSSGGVDIGRANAEVSGEVNAGFNTANLQSKLEGYLLDPLHPQNQTKATWFQQALGFDKSNWQQLGSQITFNEATAIPTKTTQYGQTFEQVISITGANGRTIDVSFVFLKDPAGTVRLVTGIPTKK